MQQKLKNSIRDKFKRIQYLAIDTPNIHRGMRLHRLRCVLMRYKRAEYNSP